MNRGLYTRVIILLGTALILSCCIWFCGCGEPSLAPLKTGVQNWKVPGIGGSLEIRPLPSADKVIADYEEWLLSRSRPTACVYEVVLRGTTNQIDLHVDISRHQTPIGSPYTTVVRFSYNDSTNGMYRFIWSKLGKHKPDFLKLGEGPTKLWVTLNYFASQTGVPLLKIVAIEGVEASGGVVAMMAEDYSLKRDRPNDPLVK